MVKFTKEQAWKEEARKAYQDQQSQDNEGGCREPIGFVQGYLAAKKSDFEEIKTIKEQLAEAVDVIEKCRRHNYLGGEAFLDRITKQFLEKQDKENKDKK